MEENGEQLLNREIQELRDLKKDLLNKRDFYNKKDLNSWTRKIDNEIRKKLKLRDQL